MYIIQDLPLLDSNAKIQNSSDKNLKMDQKFGSNGFAKKLYIAGIAYIIPQNMEIDAEISAFLYSSRYLKIRTIMLVAIPVK